MKNYFKHLKTNWKVALHSLIDFGVNETDWRKGYTQYKNKGAYKWQHSQKMI